MRTSLLAQHGVVIGIRSDMIRITSSARCQQGTQL